MLRKKKQSNSGFTLIEMLVSVAIFIIVALVVTGALLVVLQAYRKAQAGKLLTDNLNFTMENIVLNLREGNNYLVDGLSVPISTNDSQYYTSIGFRTRTGNRWAYYAWDDPSKSAWKSSCDLGEDETKPCLPPPESVVRLTSSEVQVVGEDGGPGLRFYVLGEEDGYRRIMVVLRGEIERRGEKTTLQLQSTISQRNL